MRTQPRPVLAAAATLAAALLMTGCGGGGTGPTAAPSRSTAVPSSGSTDLVTDPTPDASSDAPSTASPASASDAPSATTVADATGGSACALATEKDVAAVLGQDPGAGKPFSSHGATQCQYGDYQTAFVLVNLIPSQGKASYDHFRKDPHVGDGGTVADVSGIGDQAFSIASPMTASIYFTSGDALVLVMVEIYGSATSPMDQMLTLARLAAGRV